LTKSDKLESHTGTCDVGHVSHCKPSAPRAKFWAMELRWPSGRQAFNSTTALAPGKLLSTAPRARTASRQAQARHAPIGTRSNVDDKAAKQAAAGQQTGLLEHRRARERTVTVLRARRNSWAKQKKSRGRRLEWGLYTASPTSRATRWLRARWCPVRSPGTKTPFQPRSVLVPFTFQPRSAFLWCLLFVLIF
jgi:hypothetical protein